MQGKLLFIVFSSSLAHSVLFSDCDCQRSKKIEHTFRQMPQDELLPRPINCTIFISGMKGCLLAGLWTDIKDPPLSLVVIWVERYANVLEFSSEVI